MQNIQKRDVVMITYKTTEQLLRDIALEIAFMERHEPDKELSIMLNDKTLESLPIVKDFALPIVIDNTMMDFKVDVRAYS